MASTNMFFFSYFVVLLLLCSPFLFRIERGDIRHESDVGVSLHPKYVSRRLILKSRYIKQTTLTKNIQTKNKKSHKYQRNKNTKNNNRRRPA